MSTGVDPSQGDGNETGKLSIRALRGQTFPLFLILNWLLRDKP